MSTLECHYRRLLRWYPTAYRSRHQEEMIGVLLAAARPGQERPTWRDTADLLLAALRIRLRRVSGATAHGWRTALALVGLVASLVLAGQQLATTIALAQYPAGGVLDWVVYVGRSLTVTAIVVLALRGNRTPAAVAAWLVFALDSGFTYRMLDANVQDGGSYGVVAVQWFQVAFSGALPLLTAAALTVRTDLRRARRVVGPRARWAIALTAALAFAAEIYLESPPWQTGVPLIAPVIVGFWAGSAMGSPTGRRAALLLAPAVLLGVPSLQPAGMAGSDGLTWTGMSPQFMLLPGLAVFAAVTVGTLRRSARTAAEPPHGASLT